MATTPPLRITSVYEPPAPLHGGKHDSVRQPIIRRSTTSQARRALHTPPPNLDDQLTEPRPSKRGAPPPPPHTLSSPSSTHSSPRKKPHRSRQPGNAKEIEAKGSAFHDQIRNKRNVYLQETKLDPSAASMLPTPAKTPAKKPVLAAAVKGAARVLFPVRPDTVEEAMPKARKIRQIHHHIGFSLYSSTEDGDAGLENEFPIFTDSKDKVPEPDPTADNPFLEPPQEAPSPPEPSKGRNCRKRKASQGIECNPEIKEAFNREDGMVYVL